MLNMARSPLLPQVVSLINPKASRHTPLSKQLSSIIILPILSAMGHPPLFEMTWVSHTPLKTTYPRTYAPSNQKEATLAQCWNLEYEAWDLGLRRNLNDEGISEWSLSSPPDLLPLMTPWWKKDGDGN